jgi:hypothetical protein
MGVPDERPRGGGPGPVAAIVLGVVAALALVWVVDLVVGTFLFVVRLIALVAVVVGVLWLWGRLSRD